MALRWLFGLIVATGVLLVAGCRSASNGTSTFPEDAALGTKDSVIDNGFVACRRTIAEACPSATDQACGYASFAAATAGCGPSLTLAHCDAFDIAKHHGFDTVDVYYFDATSGALVAATVSGFDGESCLAGPSTFTPPTCTPTPIACPDAGSDAGSDALDDSSSDAGTDGG